MMKRAAILGLWVALSAAVTACSPVVRNHGYAPDPALLTDIAIGQDTRGSVQRKIGRPSSTGVFSERGWYYVASTVQHYTYHAPKVIDRRVVAVEFDENDLVVAVNTYGLEDGRVIDLETRITPTHGRKLTILQQILGNIGRFSGDEFNN